jgi:hypothetical protein
MHRYGP